MYLWFQYSKEAIKHTGTESPSDTQSRILCAKYATAQIDGDGYWNRVTVFHSLQHSSLNETQSHHDKWRLRQVSVTRTCHCGCLTILVARDLTWTTTVIPSFQQNQFAFAASEPTRRYSNNNDDGAGDDDEEEEEEEDEEDLKLLLLLLLLLLLYDFTG